MKEASQIAQSKFEAEVEEYAMFLMEMDGHDYGHANLKVIGITSRVLAEIFSRYKNIYEP